MPAPDDLGPTSPQPGDPFLDRPRPDRPGRDASARPEGLSRDAFARPEGSGRDAPAWPEGSGRDVCARSADPVGDASARSEGSGREESAPPGGSGRDGSARPEGPGEGVAGWEGVRERAVHERRRAVTDAGLAAVFALTPVYVAYRIAQSWGGGAWWFGCAAGTVVCVIALLRRGNRARAAAAGLAVATAAVLTARLAHLPAEPGPAMALALAVLTGSAVRALPWRRAGAVAAGGLALAVLAFATSAAHATVAELYGLAWLAAAGLGLGTRLLHARRRAAMERVRRDERLRLARELHDVVAHHVTSVVLQTQAARLVARRSPDRVDVCLAGIEAAGSDALAGARRVVGLLRDGAPSPESAAPAPAAVSHRDDRIGELVRRFTGPPVRFRLPEGEPGWPPEVATTVYRIVQEALTNVSRHAPHARSVSVTVTEDDDTIAVEVADDAPPAPARRLRRGGAGGGSWGGVRGGGYGLIGMRERLDALGGSLTAGPRPQRDGWAVRATLPLPARGR
ncbi:hypothetical protein GCM10010486_04430 [Nonomuraea roseoviolacea subsp. carminata]